MVVGCCDFSVCSIMKSGCAAFLSWVSTGGLILVLVRIDVDIAPDWAVGLFFIGKIVEGMIPKLCPGPPREVGPNVVFEKRRVRFLFIVNISAPLDDDQELLELFFSRHELRICSKNIGLRVQILTRFLLVLYPCVRTENGSKLRDDL